MADNIYISNYGEYSSDNYGAHCLKVTIGNLTIYFSYQTVIAFYTMETGLVIRKNEWGTTTGKHMNWIDRDKSIRIKGADFEKQINKLLKKKKLIL